MDNQQATVSWVIGILEGEGNVEQNGLKITNTDFDLIEACVNFFKQAGILHSVTTDKKKTTGGKRLYRLYISGQDYQAMLRTFGSKLQCRFQEFTGASETERDVTADLQWLIGVWQAEGSFSFSRCDRGGGSLFIKPVLTIANTNKRIIEKIVLTLRSETCSWYVKDFTPDVKKPYTRIDIGGAKRCIRFLRTTRGLWLGKRDTKRASLMQEFIDSRFSKYEKAPYSERELQIFREMNVLN